MAGFTINGIDCESTLKLYLDEAVGLIDIPPRSIGSEAIRGRSGRWFGAQRDQAGRELKWSMILQPATVTAAARITAEHLVRDAFGAGMLSIQFNDGSTTRRIDGVCTELVITPRRGSHPFLAPISDVDIRISCASAFWESVQPTILALTTTARYPIELGTGPSTPLIMPMGATSAQTVTYRTAGGDVVWQIKTTNAATTDYSIVDFRTGRVKKSASGVVTDDEANAFIYTVWSTFPQPFDPQDGDYRTSQWPTLEVDSGAVQAIYWKSWQ